MAFLKKACLDQSFVSGPSVDFPFALEGFVTKPFHLEKMNDFLVDGLLSNVTVVSRDRAGKGTAWVAGGTVHVSADLICSFQKLNPSSVCSVLAVPFLPNAQWMSQRGALSWITEQLVGYKAGIRYWDPGGSINEPLNGFKPGLEISLLGIFPREIKP